MQTRVTRSSVLRSVIALALLMGAAPLASATATACEAGLSGASLLVRVSGLASKKGNLTITVYPDDSDRFLAKGGKLARQRLPVVLPLTEACFALPAAGSYGVAVYHDANGDHDFNRTLIGMPAEGYGFSNNPVTKLGLPQFKQVRFAAGAGATPVYIKLTY